MSGYFTDDITDHSSGVSSPIHLARPTLAKPRSSSVNSMTSYLVHTPTNARSMSIVSMESPSNSIVSDDRTRNNSISSLNMEYKRSSAIISDDEDDKPVLPSYKPAHDLHIPPHEKSPKLQPGRVLNSEFTPPLHLHSSWDHKKDRKADWDKKTEWKKADPKCHAFKVKPYKPTNYESKKKANPFTSFQIENPDKHNPFFPFDTPTSPKSSPVKEFEKDFECDKRKGRKEKGSDRKELERKELDRSDKSDKNELDRSDKNELLSSDKNEFRSFEDRSKHFDKKDHLQDTRLHDTLRLQDTLRLDSPKERPQESKGSEKNDKPASKRFDRQSSKTYIKKMYSKELQFELMHSNTSPVLGPTEARWEFAVPKKTATGQNRLLTQMNQKWNKSVKEKKTESTRKRGREDDDDIDIIHI